MQLYPGESQFHRNSSASSLRASSILEIKTEVMAEHILSQQRKRLWSQETPAEGVMLKKERGHYACAPNELASGHPEFVQAVQAMNVRVSLPCLPAVLPSRLISNRSPS